MSRLPITYVMPAFNAATTIEESVDSIFDNNFSTGDRVIIVNDASTDTTELAIKKLSAKYTPHITYIKNGINKGCPASRNRGITEASTPLIFNLDADNILLPDSIQKLEQTLRDTKSDVVTFSQYNYFINSPAMITHYWYLQSGICRIENLFAGHINPAPGGNFLYTKASWERIGGYWEYGKGLHEAWGFSLKQLMAGNRMYVASNTAYLHRHGHDSLFVTESKRKQEEHRLLLQMLSPYKEHFTTNDWQRIEQDSSWYYSLKNNPIAVDGIYGADGTMVVTWYGRLWSLQRKIRSLLSL